MEETLRDLIAGVAAGAAEGAEALRRRGIPLVLDAYTVETRIDRDEPVTSIRVDFIVTPARAGPDSLADG